MKTKCFGGTRRASSSRRRHEAFLQPSNGTGKDRITRVVLGTHRHERRITESCKGEEDNVALRVVEECQARASTRRPVYRIIAPYMLTFRRESCIPERTRSFCPLKRTTGQMNLCCTVVGKGYSTTHANVPKRELAENHWRSEPLLHSSREGLQYHTC